MPGRRASEETRREQILKAAYDVAAHRGIDGLTVRAVAARAKLSHGLVLFHFKRKDQLLSALLDRVLATSVQLEIPDEIARMPSALDRVRALLQQEISRLSDEPRRTRLFFEYWALGTRHPAIRSKMSAAIDRYRAAFREISEEALRAEPARAVDVTPDGMAAIAVSLINGCAVQAMIDPHGFDIGQYLAAVHQLIGELDGGRPQAREGLDRRSARRARNSLRSPDR